jgi:DNA-binding beta-propeller fold protein YncE
MDFSLQALVTVGLSNGARTILSSNAVPNTNNPFSNASTFIALDAANSRALVTDEVQQSVIAVALGNGARTPLSSAAVPDTSNVLQQALGIAVDPGNNRALVTDFDLSTVAAVDLETGARVLLSR